MNRIAARTLLGVLCILAASCAHQKNLSSGQISLADTFIWYDSPDPNGSNNISFILDGKLIYVDPVFEAGTAATLPKADLILVTHGHLDHYSVSSIQELSGPDTRVAGFWRLGLDVSDPVTFNPYEAEQIAGLTIHTFPAINAKHAPGNKGLAFTVSDGYQTVFISGDTDFHSGFTGIGAVDVAVYFITPPFTLPVGDARKLTKKIKPAVIIPIHWNSGEEETIAELIKKTGSNSTIRVLDRK